ncbi:MAG: hypothetical protein KDK63_02615 [Chlamydiia bacterium]|nr:hypothetical protein [Chlamydiia bacterium]
MTKLRLETLFEHPGAKDLGLPELYHSLPHDLPFEKKIATLTKEIIAYYPLLKEKETAEIIHNFDTYYTNNIQHLMHHARVQFLIRVGEGCHILDTSEELRQKTYTWIEKHQKDTTLNLYFSLVPLLLPELRALKRIRVINLGGSPILFLPHFLTTLPKLKTVILSPDHKLRDPHTFLARQTVNHH